MSTEAKEIPDEMTCPCGSGKVYKECCKGKEFIWMIDNEEIIFREVPLPEEVMEELEELSNMFENVFGRKPEDRDFAFYSGIVNQIDYDNSLIKVSRAAGMEESHIYATYKTGLIPTEFNIDKMPEKDYNEWAEAVREFDEMMNEKLEDNEMSIVQFVLLVNDYLSRFIERAFSELELGISKFIVDCEKGPFDIGEFEVDSQERFIEYCLYKTIRNLHAIRILADEGYTENSLATVRFIYETYLNVAVFSSKLYEEKIEPLIGLDKGTHIRKKIGKMENR